MQESTLPSRGVVELTEVLSNPERAGNVYSRRDQLGLLFIKALCRTPQGVDIGALVRGDLKMFGYSIGALAINSATSRARQKFAHLSTIVKRAYTL
jgi:hypothetical protein